jgi:thioredoxin 1
MASEKIQTLTDATFKNVIEQSTIPVLVDFWATWCMPCLRIAPTIDQLAADYDGKLLVGKVNVDENPSTPMTFGIRGIPTLLLFKGGKLVDSVVGLASKDDLKRLIDRHV